MPAPHQSSIFTRLLGLFQQQAHPSGSLPPLEGGGGDDMGEQMSRAHALRGHYALSADRAARYRAFNSMDQGSAAAIADLYAEEATQYDYGSKKILWITSPDKEVERQGNECLVNLLADDMAFSICRRMIVFGDHFRQVVAAPGAGVLGWVSVPDPATVSRVDDTLGRLVGFRETGKKFRLKGASEVSWPWDYIHFRLPGKYDEARYGTAVFDTLFQPWRSLELAENAKTLLMLRRAGDRNLVMVDVGDLDDDEGMAYVNRWRKAFRKKEWLDPAAPGYAKQFDALTPDEDIFMPIRGADTNSRIDTLPGTTSADQIYDLNYFRDKFYGAARVPKAYMGIGEGGADLAKSSLARLDMRFSRSVSRVQRACAAGFRSILEFHYTLRGHVTVPQFTVHMTPVSYPAEMERIEVVRLRTELLEAMGNLGNTLRLDPKLWVRHVLTDIAQLPPALVQALTAGIKAEPEEKSESLSLVDRVRLEEAFKASPLPRIVEGIVGAVNPVADAVDLTTREIFSGDREVAHLRGADYVKFRADYAALLESQRNAKS